MVKILSPAKKYWANITTCPFFCIQERLIIFISFSLRLMFSSLLLYHSIFGHCDLQLQVSSCYFKLNHYLTYRGRFFSFHCGDYLPCRVNKSFTLKVNCINRYLKMARGRSGQNIVVITTNKRILK